MSLVTVDAVPFPATDSLRPDPRRRMEELVAQYRGLIGAMVRRVGRQAPAHVHEDIQQRVMIALWKQLRRDRTIDYPS